VALIDGRISLTVRPPERSFISQPIDINSSKPRFDLIEIIWSPSELSLRVSGLKLLPDTPGATTLLLPPPIPAPSNEVSINDPNAIAACQNWIQNRRSKFSKPKPTRTNRRPKTIEEQADDLRTSIYVLKTLQQNIITGNRHLLGMLAAEMRACVYWAQDTLPDRNYNPLLLRMASLADLPLPVYFMPEIPVPPLIESADMRLTFANAPRVRREFKRDEVRDLQESLKTTVLRIGQSPIRAITALELIKELAHTAGASHYDEDASEFLDIMRQMKTEQGDQVTIFMCQTAEVLASLSDWVLSELKTRNLIA
jgi:hypothetical protein